MGSGLAWVGLDWVGLVWIGLGLVRFELGLVWRLVGLVGGCDWGLVWNVRVGI